MTFSTFGVAPVAISFLPTCLAGVSKEQAREMKRGCLDAGVVECEDFFRWQLVVCFKSFVMFFTAKIGGNVPA